MFTRRDSPSPWCSHAELLTDLALNEAVVAPTHQQKLHAHTQRDCHAFTQDVHGREEEEEGSG